MTVRDLKPLRKEKKSRWFIFITSCYTSLDSKPNDKILDISILRAFVDSKLNVTQNLKLAVGIVEKHCAKRRNCCISAVSPVTGDHSFMHGCIPILIQYLITVLTHSHSMTPFDLYEKEAF